MILVISRFGFEGWIWVLIAAVPDLRIFFTFSRETHIMIDSEIIFDTTESRQSKTFSPIDKCESKARVESFFGCKLWLTGDYLPSETVSNDF